MGERGGSCSRRGLTALPCPSRLVVRMCGGSVHRSIPSEDRRRSPETRMAHCTKAVAWSREPIPVDRGRPMIESEPFRSSFPTKWICEGGRYPGECRTDCLSGECCYLPLTSATLGCTPTCKATQPSAFPRGRCRAGVFDFSISAAGLITRSRRSDFSNSESNSAKTQSLFSIEKKSGLPYRKVQIHITLGQKHLARD